MLSPHALAPRVVAAAVFAILLFSLWTYHDSLLPTLPTSAATGDSSSSSSIHPVGPPSPEDSTQPSLAKPSRPVDGQNSKQESATQPDQEAGTQNQALPQSQNAQQQQNPPSGGCVPELQFLFSKAEKLNVSSNITYARRCIKTVYSETTIDRQQASALAEPLINAWTAINLGDCRGVDSIPCEPLELQVPHPYSTSRKYSQLIFGVASQYDRLRAAKDVFAHWLADSDALLVGIVVKKPKKTESLEKDKATGQKRDEENFPALEQEYADAGMKLRLVEPHSEKHGDTQSHMMVLLDMLDQSTAGTHWLSLVDDDTFFPSLAPLADSLAQIDHTQSAYLGELTEDRHALRYGFGAFGGGGIFVSVPLARELAPHLGNCTSSRGGDMQLMDCIYRHTWTKLTRLSGLQQMDLMGDPSGFFESGRRFLSLHHWKSWFHEPIARMATAVRICGDCFLQRWSFAGSTVLTNAYSIVVYPGGLPDLTKMEGTWKDWEKGDFDWSLGPLRPKLLPEEKHQYKFKDAWLDDTGVLRQFYVRKGDIDRKTPDEVIELVWAP